MSETFSETFMSDGTPRRFELRRVPAGNVQVTVNGQPAGQLVEVDHERGTLQATGVPVGAEIVATYGPTVSPVPGPREVEIAPGVVMWAYPDDPALHLAPFPAPPPGIKVRK